MRSKLPLANQPFHLPGYQSPFSLLEEDLIDSIDVFTGGFPARYGNRLAGVFDIESAEAGQAPKTAIGISFINAHARTAGETDDGTSSWRASARQGTMRPVLQYLSVDAGRPELQRFVADRHASAARGSAVERQRVVGDG